MEILLFCVVWRWNTISLVSHREFFLYFIKSRNQSTQILFLYTLFIHVKCERASSRIICIIDIGCRYYLANFTIWITWKEPLTNEHSLERRRIIYSQFIYWSCTFIVCTCETVWKLQLNTIGLLSDVWK